MLVGVSVGVSGATVIAHPVVLSPIDEWVYVDYLYKIPEHPIVLKGEPIGEQALDIMACAGVTPYGPMGPKCGSDYSDISAFPFGGITSADPYTPIYFYTTWVTAAPLIAAGVDDLTAWRLASSLWLPAGLIVFFFLLRRWSVHPLAILGLGLAFIGSPFSYWTYSYVSTDAPAFLMGAALLYLATRYVAGSISGWWVPAVAVLAVMLKVTNILAVGVAVLFMLVVGVQKLLIARGALPEPEDDLMTGERRPKIFAMAALVVVMPIIVEAAWLAVNQATASTTQRASQGVGTPLTLEELLSQLINFLPNTINSNVPVVGWDHYALDLPGFLTSPLSWLCIAGVIGAVAAMRGASHRSALAITVGLASVLAAPLLALMLQVTTGSYFSLPPRYGAGILAGILLVAGLTLLRRRGAMWVLVAYGAGMCFVVPVLAFKMTAV